MLSHTVKDPSSTPIPARHIVNDDTPQNDSESSALISKIDFVRNSTQAVSTEKNISMRLTGGIPASVWNSLRRSDGGHSGRNLSDGEETGMIEMLAMGETLRQQAISLYLPSKEAPVPHDWKGSFLKRCLVGVGLLTGSGILGGASYTGYKYYQARKGATDTPGKNLQPEPWYTTPEAIKMQEDYGGSLEDPFGHHALYHDSPTNKTRHSRRHLPMTIYNTTESNQNDSEEENDPQTYLKITNRKVKDLFRREGLLSEQEIIPREKMLHAVSRYLYYDKNIAIENDNRMESLAQTILSDSGIYGENKNEKLSSKQAYSVVRYWFFKNILGTSPEKYIESEIKIDISRSYTIDDIHRLLPLNNVPAGRNFHPDRLSKNDKLLLSAIWKEFLIEEMPFLSFYNERVQSIPLNNHHFANLYSGSRFIKDIKGEDITVEEIISTGESMWDLATTEGISEDKLTYYFMPAILFYTTNLPNETEKNKDDIDIVNRYLQHRQEINEVKKDINEKLKTYLSATKLWISKGELADNIIAQCPILKPGLSDLADAIRTPDQHREKARVFAKQNYLNGFIKPCDSAPENLDDEYKKLTAAVSDSFQEIDKYIILSAFSTLSKDERTFIFSPKAIMHLAKLVVNTSAFGRFIINGDTSKEVDILLNKTDLFSVQQDKQERIYALQAIKDSQGGYKLIRVDRNISKYIMNDIFHENFRKMYVDNRDYVNIKENNFNELYRFVKIPLAIQSNNIKSLVDTLSNNHRIALFNDLYESGNDKSDLQKVWSVAKHLIPFYDCIDDIVDNDMAEAIPGCFMDVISLIPVFGQATTLSTKFAMGLARGFRSGAVIAGREGMKAAGKNMIREVSLPTTVELASLGKNSLRALDPGFELLVGITSISRKFAENIVKLISDNKKISALAKKLNIRITKLPKTLSDTQVVGILPWTKLEVPVTNIGKQNGKNIYVKINPETGEKFGNKFLCLKNGVLEPVSSILGRNKRSDNGIYIDSNHTNRVKRAGDKFDLCSEQPSTSRASQSHIISNVSSDMLLQQQGESTIEWARRLLEWNFSVSDIARRTGLSRYTIAKWPEVDKIRQQKEN